MPRPILRTPQQQTQTNSLLSTAPQQRQQMKQAQQLDKMKMDRLLRKPRSKAYMDAVHRLDAGGHVHNQNKVNGLSMRFGRNFPKWSCGVMLGIVSQCYLGKPYEVHTLDLGGGIIEHYKSGQPLPGGLEKARSIAIRGGYDFVEVYSDCCRAVSSSGSVAVLQAEKGRGRICIEVLWEEVFLPICGQRL